MLRDDPKPLTLPPPGTVAAPEAGPATPHLTVCPKGKTIVDSPTQPLKAAPEQRAAAQLRPADNSCLAHVTERKGEEVSMSRQERARALADQGQRYFQCEDYACAENCYAAALKLEPAMPDWQDMLDAAQANAIAQVQAPVPAVHRFDRETLLAAPAIQWNDLPEPLPAPPAACLHTRVLIAVGNAAGAIFSTLFDTVTYVYGRLMGYRDAIWTNWYDRGSLGGILTLAYMREQLNARNLVSTYPPDALCGFQKPGLAPPRGVTHFRTADGSWNNLSDPKEGAAGTRFMRNVALEATRPATGKDLLEPNPRLVSRVLLTRPGKELDEEHEVRFLNLIAAAWIQFMNHDWISHGETQPLSDSIDIPLSADDPIRLRSGHSVMKVARTQPDPTRPDGAVAATSFINEVTHWWDGSQIYGSDPATQNRLRCHRDGKLRVNPDGTLPLRNGVEDSGFVRNWWLGLSMLHALFVAEHNAICDHLKAAHPDWDDHRLFNVARLINAAVMAKIHTIEWTPAILPNRTAEKGLNANWYGLLTLFRKRRNRKTLAPINVRNPEAGGVVGNPINKHAQPFGFSEEFTEVYRLHSLLPETLRLRRRQDEDPNAFEPVALAQTRQSGASKITADYALPDLFFSFGVQHPGALVLNNFPHFMQELSIPGTPVLDLGAVDVLRARERGVPRYNEFRRRMGLTPIERFEDLTDDAEHVTDLKEVYGDSPQAVERLDLMIGALAEGHRPTHFGFGETLFQIFILNATRRLQADRFYTDAYNEDVYTPEGLRWIDATNFKTVILRHYPELASTGLANITNAFEPWDSTTRLDPERHPLRAYDPELGKDPWLGDGYRHRD
jgi:hypothetical protein